jgi:hypothetical protein
MAVQRGGGALLSVKWHLMTRCEFLEAARVSAWGA